MDRDDRSRPFAQRPLDGFGRHGERVPVHVDEHRHGSDAQDGGDRRAGRVRHRHDLVPGTDSDGRKGEGQSICP